MLNSLDAPAIVAVASSSMVRDLRLTGGRSQSPQRWRADSSPHAIVIGPIVWNFLPSEIRAGKKVLKMCTSLVLSLAHPTLQMRLLVGEFSWKSVIIVKFYWKARLFLQKKIHLVGQNFDATQTALCSHSAFFKRDEVTSCPFIKITGQFANRSFHFRKSFTSFNAIKWVTLPQSFTWSEFIQRGSSRLQLPRFKVHLEII